MNERINVGNTDTHMDELDGIDITNQIIEYYDCEKNKHYLNIHEEDTIEFKSCNRNHQSNYIVIGGILKLRGFTNEVISKR